MCEWNTTAYPPNGYDGYSNNREYLRWGGGSDAVGGVGFDHYNIY